MVGKMVIPAIGQAVKLFFAKWKIEFEVYGALGIVRAVRFGNLELRDFCLIDADRGNKGFDLILPELEGVFPGIGPDEIFDFHLLDLAQTEEEVARSDLIAESFADLGDAERHFRVE